MVSKRSAGSPLDIAQELTSSFEDFRQRRGSLDKLLLAQPSDLPGARSVGLRFACDVHHSSDSFDCLNVFHYLARGDPDHPGKPPSGGLLTQSSCRLLDFRFGN